MEQRHNISAFGPRLRRQWGHLIICAVLALTVGCTGGNGGRTKGPDADSINWEDSALTVNQPLETYFFNDEIDSLLMVAPQVLDFCREHEVWWVFYSAWERKAEAFAWQGEYDHAAEEADEMRRDAERRSRAGECSPEEGAYGQAMAYYVLAQGYAMQDNYDEATTHYQQAIDLYPDDLNPSMLANIYSVYAEVLALKGDFGRMDSMMPRWKQIIDRKPVTGTDAQQDDVAASWRFPYFTKLFMRDVIAI